MPKNKGKGGKNQRPDGKNENDDDKRELVFPEDGQEYAQVCINRGDIVLLSLPDSPDDKADVIVKYTVDDVLNLKACGELPIDSSVDLGDGE
ncbi:hypothetical protein B0H10DRAFT_2237339 [Mycena sp. CBHHK59/15]|nr:hypothetical protein B0H10DRAFT_2237339 [Mycena sp. CBHHK59/15]